MSSRTARVIECRPLSGRCSPLLRLCFISLGVQVLDDMATLAYDKVVLSMGNEVSNVPESTPAIE